MCVLAMAWRADRRWRLVAAGNRDELHARPAVPLARWGNGVIAGRDAVGGGTWLGVSETGRFAVVTNVRSSEGADPAKLSRGKLVSDALLGVGGDVPERFNPFNLIIVGGEMARFVTNRPGAFRCKLEPGLHGLSNGLHDAPWPKTRALQAALAEWIAAGKADPAGLFAALRDERPMAGATDDGSVEPVTSPIFMRDARYGTRCSTVVTVDAAGRGMIAERRFDVAGDMTGETRLEFSWPI
jgi:uncharacterized protein with NRDE domain